MEQSPDNKNEKMGSADSCSNSGRNNGSCEEHGCPGQTGTASAVTLGTEIMTVTEVPDNSNETYNLTVRGTAKYNILLKVRDLLEKHSQEDAQRP